ncbi:hypothetical protein PLICRDRAFT_222027 [Plicaturopsis crispa FD-325 SS-3]|nr:hypothetical protein PLICRDRAFT_222027 [Plicaturopsis crispa FD-325 SS-3]
MEGTQALLRLIHATRICQLAPASVALYDHAITIDQEVELIWSKKWSISKLFISTVLIFIMQIIMQLRVYAMYRQSRRIALLLCTNFFAEIAAATVLLVLTELDTDDSISQRPIPGGGLCTVVGVPRYLGPLWFPIMAFESMLVSLALWVGIRHVWKMPNWTPGRILRVLLRDSIFYYVIIISAYAVNAYIWLSLSTLGAIWLEIPPGFSIAATVIMGSRLILNLRRVYWSQQVNESGVAEVSYIHPVLRHARSDAIWSLQPLSPDDIDLGYNTDDAWTNLSEQG